MSPQTKLKFKQTFLTSRIRVIEYNIEFSNYSEEKIKKEIKRILAFSEELKGIDMQLRKLAEKAYSGQLSAKF